MGLNRLFAAHKAALPCTVSAARARLKARIDRRMTVSVAASSASKRSCSVAVIGAGAAGLVAARELRAEGHDVVVLEQGQQIGGVWVYDEHTEADLLGVNKQRRRVHSSMYRGLRTNLPREIMAFNDFPFDPAVMGGRSVDSRRFCSHEEVCRYLDAFAEWFDLKGLVQFGTRVVAVQPVPRTSSGDDKLGRDSLHSNSSSSNSSSRSRSSSQSRVIADVSKGLQLQQQQQQQQQQQGMGSADRQGAWLCETGEAVVETSPQWEVTTAPVANDGSEEQQATASQVFDAVVVCNGHYNEPNLPDVPGADSFPGLLMHSHNYRVPETFKGQTVLIVGASNSGEDICREVAGTARRVIICARSWKNTAWAEDDTPFGPRANIERRGMVTRLTLNGTATFEWGAAVEQLDAVIYCTGYRYSFPFLEGTGVVSTAEQHVAPLYQHIFPPAVAPTLAFVGLPFKIVPFPQFELQSKLIARLLSGRAQLPSREEMQQHVQAFYKQLHSQGVPARWTHMQASSQFEYNAWLADMCGGDVQKLPKWRERMYTSTGENKRKNPEQYRDVWEDAESAAQAAADTKLLVQRLMASQAHMAAQAASELHAGLHQRAEAAVA